MIQGLYASGPTKQTPHVTKFHTDGNPRLLEHGQEGGSKRILSTQDAAVLPEPLLISPTLHALFFISLHILFCSDFPEQKQLIKNRATKKNNYMQTH